MSPPPDLVAAVQALWGPGDWIDRSRPGPNRVWEHPRGFIKMGTAGGFRQAQRALTQWLPALGTRRLAAAFPEHRALLTWRVPGVPATATPATFEAAGAWLRRLHDLPCTDPDSVPLARAIPARVARAADALGVSVQVNASCLVQTPRVPCHRDFHPRNWFVEPFGVIDFEHARLDHPLLDVVRLWEADERCRDAFAGSYGYIDPEELAVVEVLHALQSLEWGRRHDAPAFAAEGRRLLERRGISLG